MSVPSLVGMSSYLADFESDHHRLLVGVLCRVGDAPNETVGLLDTASEWCVLPARLAPALGIALQADPSVRPLSTRLGLIYGRMERLPLTFLAADGCDVAIEATFFVSADWFGPLVVGWKGCLERMRFMIDPEAEQFHFAGL